MNLDTWRTWKEALANGEVRKATRLFDRLIQENTPLAQTILATKFNLVTVDREDLLQAALCTMGECMKTYDPTRGTFGNYSYIRILDAIQRAINDGGTGTKVHRRNATRKLLDPIARKLEAEGKEVTPETLGVSEEMYERWRASKVFPKLVYESPKLGHSSAAREDWTRPEGRGLYFERPGALLETLSGGHCDEALANDQLIDRLDAALETLCPDDRLVAEVLFMGRDWKDIRKNARIQGTRVRKYLAKSMGLTVAELELRERVVLLRLKGALEETTNKP